MATPIFINKQVQCIPSLLLSSLLRIRHSFLVVFNSFNSSLIKTPLKFLIFNSLHLSIISKLFNGFICLNVFINLGNDLTPSMALKKPLTYNWLDEQPITYLLISNAIFTNTSTGTYLITIFDTQS